ncbi:hypothetical protein ACFOY4_30740 [Actinomadura syzygii]|uniref:Uncharacterized protein n=1 Tax=Actinomadura syzygii TaxID=1427538 RepID=A0A5D0TSJ5_9ACTN|nr:hypothetical protein [Actinomadura syzygii]TYC08703.1 hypothetical protein FXF65_38145 [Actinomadura syzygii]
MFIQSLDVDDELESDFLKSLHDALGMHTSAGLVAGQARYLLSDGISLEAHLICPEGPSRRAHRSVHDQPARKASIAASTIGRRWCQMRNSLEGKRFPSFERECVTYTTYGGHGYFIALTCGRAGPAWHVEAAPY